MIPVFVGISGGTGSGKSTFAQKIKNKLIEIDYHCTLVEMDGFYKEKLELIRAPYTKNEYLEWNHPDSIDKDKVIKHISSIESQGMNEVILIEGLFSIYYEEIRDKLDYKIFIDLLPDERLYRRIKRGRVIWNETIDQISARYLDSVRYRHDEFVEPLRWYSDVVINGNNFSENAIMSVVKNIERLINIKRDIVFKE